MKWSECKELIRKDYAQLVGNAQISGIKTVLGGARS